MTPDCTEECGIHRIATLATPLWARQHSFAPGAKRIEQALSDAQVDRWRKILGSAEALSVRLSKSSFGVQFDEIDVPSRPSGNSALPGWATTLADILNPASSFRVGVASKHDDRALKRQRPLPFQEVLLPFVRFARDRLTTQAGPAMSIVAPTAVAQLEHHLLSHLTFLASLALGQSFYEYRFDRAPLASFELAWGARLPSTEIYQAYVEFMNQHGLPQLFEQYPVLARLLSQATEQWIDTSVAFCRRLDQDFSALAMTFHWNLDQHEGAVVGLRPGLSDRHNGGQSVTECELSTGDRIIYKPRTVRPEIAYHHVVHWLNERGLQLHLRELRALDRGTHGWVESVVPAPCHSEAEAKRFYYRAGMLLGVLHLLAVTDIHCENLIASGEHPVVVDLETLLDEGQPPSGSLAADSSAKEPIGDNSALLRTGLLPRWQESSDGTQFDLSALGADGTQDPDSKGPTWISINSDQMRLSEAAPGPGPTAHRVRLDDQVVSVADHLTQLLAGFQEVYLCLMKNRREILADQELLRNFDGLELRILVRSSSTYSRLLLHLLHPEFLKDGIDRSIGIECLARPLSGDASHEQETALLYERECAALEQFDIPHFTTSWSETLDPIQESEALPILRRKRGSRIVRSRLLDLSQADCLRQLAVIEDSVLSRFAMVRA